MSTDMCDKLVITINDANNFFSLYADGDLSEKHYDKESGITELTYDDNAIIFLYYTYPTHRRVYCVRNCEDGEQTLLPGLSKKVNVIFKQIASRVDKTRRAAAFLREHRGSAYKYTDEFYTRLSFLIDQKGKINYSSIEKLLEDKTKTVIYIKKLAPKKHFAVRKTDKRKIGRKIPLKDDDSNKRKIASKKHFGARKTDIREIGRKIPLKDDDPNKRKIGRKIPLRDDNPNKRKIGQKKLGRKTKVDNDKSGKRIIKSKKHYFKITFR
ncbi:MAG: hypothetical protein Ta2C_10990 [Candidatus Endomicrobiellum trichonymphae]|uniref:hypothetical protein n=1 Tax=Endomicrobium trichonymphae TaxID=1408204 RepID=UPI0027D4256B|nr:MAG: hypothetical protein Ta2C_10990 [Candidatus Endomicrobium trichonymphae]